MPLTDEAIEVYRRKTLHRCVLDKAPDRAELEEKYYRKEMTQSEIAMHLGVSEQQVSEHFRFHIPNQVAGALVRDGTIIEELKDLVIDKLGILKGKITKLNSLVDTAISSLEADGENMDPSKVLSLKSLASELRNYIKDTALLEGELRSAPLLQLQQVNVEFNQIKSVVLNSLPPEYQLKVAEALAQLEGSKSQ